MHRLGVHEGQPTGAINQKQTGTNNMNHKYIVWLAIGTGLLGLPFAATAQVKIGANPTQIVPGAELQINGDSSTSTPASLIVNGTGNVGIGTANPQNRVEITSSAAGTSGLRFTNLTSASTIATGAAIGVNATGDVVRVAATAGGSICGDVKFGLQSADHSGWFLMNGSSWGTLIGSQTSCASSLGISTSRPNAANRVLMQTGSVNTTGGSNSVTLAQANLPNINFPAATTSSYTHSHSPLAPDYDCCGPDSQGYAANNNHQGFRTTDRGGGWRTSNMISSNTHNHTVTVSSGGSNTAITTTPAYLSMNAFVYLGN